MVTAEPTVVALLKDLREIGFEVASACDLFNRRLKYPTAIPVLARHLSEIQDAGHRLCVVRALSLRRSNNSEALLALLAEFERVPPVGAPSSYRWTVASSISALAGPEVEGWLVTQVLDPALGEDRIPFLEALGRLHGQASLLALEQCLSGSETALGALRSLIKRRARSDSIVEAAVRLSRSADRKERAAAERYLRSIAAPPA